MPKRPCSSCAARCSRPSVASPLSPGLRTRCTVSAVSVVLMIEMIFLLSIFAEIFTTTGGGPGFDTTTITFMIYQQALLSYDVGAASAGALFAVLIANIAAFFLMRVIGKNLSK